MLSDTFKISVILFIFLFEICVGMQNVSSYIPNEDNAGYPRVIGGFRPPVHILPKYIVSIRKRSERSDQFGYSHFCAGSIISPNTILTAAHCVVDGNGAARSATFFKIAAKTPIRLKKTENSQEVNVKKVTVHHNYNNNKLLNDIALLILEENITLDGQLAAKVMLPHSKIKSGAVCTVIGWGEIYWSGPSANNILYAELTTQPSWYCRRLPFFNRKKVCVVDKEDNAKQASRGDSGGPLLCNEILTGIVSYGGRKGSVVAYTNVYEYLDWIATGHSNLLKSVNILHVVTLLLIIVCQ